MEGRIGTSQSESDERGTLSMKLLKSDLLLLDILPALPSPPRVPHLTQSELSLLA